MYQRLEFGADAKAFIRFRLSRQPTFWRLLCDLPLEMGRVTAFLPPDVTLRHLLHFGWHLDSGDDLVGTNTDYTFRTKHRELIAEMLEEQQGRASIFFGRTVPPGKPVPDLKGAITSYYHKLRYPNNYSDETPTVTEVYYFIKAGISRPDLDYGLDNVFGYPPSMGAFVSLPKEFPPLPEDRCFDTETLKVLAQRTETIMVSAYEDDAVLVWTRM